MKFPTRDCGLLWAIINILISQVDRWIYWWISLASVPSLVRNFMPALYSMIWLSIFALYGCRFSNKKSNKCTRCLNGCYHSTDNGLHYTKMKKEILNWIEKYRVLQTYWPPLVWTIFCHKIRFHQLYWLKCQPAWLWVIGHSNIDKQILFYI